MKNLFLTSCLALSLTSGLLATDIFIVDSVNGGAATGSPKLNLDNLVLGNASQDIDAVIKVSFTDDAQVVQHFADGLYARPFLSTSNGIGFGSPDQPTGVDTTKYLSTGRGSVVLQFASQQNYFGLLWGSVDNYNTLEFWNGGDLVGSFTGLNVWDLANGNQGEQGTFYVNFTDTSGTFNKVIAKSSGYAFEFDNIAYNGRTTTTQSVPDSGATLAFVGLAFAGLVAARRKR